MHDTGCLGLVHWDDPEGGYGEGGGAMSYNSPCQLYAIALVDKPRHAQAKRGSRGRGLHISDLFSFYVMDNGKLR